LKQANFVDLFWDFCPILNLQGCKCEGTIKSGRNREIKEGKKYSSMAYYISERAGKIALNKAPGGRLDIHNSGSQSRKSTIIDIGINEKWLLSNINNVNEIKTLLSNNNAVYQTR